MGRRALPTAVHEQNGNPSKLNLAERKNSEPQPEKLMTLPLPPDVLTDSAKDVWNDMGHELLKLGLLTLADLPAFIGFCINYGLMIEAAQNIKDKGMMVRGARGAVRNPAIAALTAASAAVKTFAVEFGMTPSARSRMKVQGDSGDPLGFLNDGDDEDFGKGV